MSDLATDVWRGLNTAPKYLQSKYFYDAVGDEIFQEIMACPEYYLTRCEYEICSTQSSALADKLLSHVHDIEVVEMGPGDATKSIYILEALLQRLPELTYYPIDISGHVIANLKEQLPLKLPGIKVHGLEGDYFEMLRQLKTTSDKRKLVLFMGANIGNTPLEKNIDLLLDLRSHLQPGDMALIGFDLKKEPSIIRAAYNDKGGVTRRFNMNLLTRINKELGANFDLSQFDHRPEYNEQTGASRSFLVSLKDQDVQIGDLGMVHFEQEEKIFMEISQKYTVQQTDDLAIASGFVPVHHYHDSKHWFLDALWVADEPLAPAVDVMKENAVMGAS